MENSVLAKGQVAVDEDNVAAAVLSARHTDTLPCRRLLQYSSSFLLDRDLVALVE